MPFNTLDPSECERQAKDSISKVVELLCCEPSVAQLLLRSYHWDKEKLTDGALSGLWLPAACLAPLRDAVRHALLTPCSAPAQCLLRAIFAPKCEPLSCIAGRRERPQASNAHDRVRVCHLVRAQHTQTTLTRYRSEPACRQKMETTVP